MPRDWSDLFIRPTGAATTPRAAQEQRAAGGLFRRLRESLRATREALGGEIQRDAVRGARRADLGALEEALIVADVGAPTTAAVVAELEREARAERARGRGGAARAPVELLAETAHRRATGAIDLRAKPTVILMVGVNGTGKTTTLGKLAWQLREQLGCACCSAPPTPTAPPPPSSSRAGRERAGCEIVTGAPGLGPRRGRLRGARAGARRAATTSCSSTPPGACTTRSR